MNTSHCADSSASSAARPPRANSPTARPIRPPIPSCNTRPPARRLRARAASYRSNSRSSGLGRSSAVTPNLHAVLEREVDAAELEIARHVLQEVDELQPGADVVARGDELGLAVQAKQAEHEAADGVGRVAAVLLQVVPGLVLGDALIHPVRLDQSQERLARKRELVDGRRKRLQDRPGGLARVAGVELLLELVERGEPIALDLVPEHVDEPGEAVDGAQVRSEAAREQHRGNREVLGPRAAGYDGDLHPHKPHWPGPAGQPATFA